MPKEVADDDDDDDGLYNASLVRCITSGAGRFDTRAVGVKG